MNERLARGRERITLFWNQFSKTQKWVLASTAAFLLLAIIILTYIFSRTEYEVAFQNLDSTDSAAIMEYLDGAGISYHLTDGGTSITVPSAVASKVKVAIGSQGLVQNGSIGFAEISKSSSAIGTTDQEFQVKFRNALNGEIQQLLLSKQGVAKVKALITLPEASVFVADEEKAKASVVITFKPGYRPKQDEIDSYYNLVKSAVQNLAFEDITIGSPSGDLLPSNQIGGGAGAGGGAAFETQNEIKQQFDNDLRRNVQQYLTPLVGMDNMVVSVTSSLNFDNKSSVEKTVVPLPDNDNNGIVVSTENSSETSEGTNGQTGGVAGTGATDISNYPGSAGSGTSSSERVSEVINYDYTTITSNIDYGPYKVNDLAINVAVNSASVTPEVLTAIQGALSNTVRVVLAESSIDLTDAALAQRVSVISQAFGGVTETSGGSTVQTSWLIGIGALVLLLLIVGGFLLFRRRKAAAAEAAAAAELAAIPRVELPTIDIDNVANESQVRKQLESLAKRKPEEFVNLLRTWLVDE